MKYTFLERETRKKVRKQLILFHLIRKNLLSRVTKDLEREILTFEEVLCFDKCRRYPKLLFEFNYRIPQSF
jgi:hypothetical protein